MDTIIRFYQGNIKMLLRIIAFLMIFLFVIITNAFSQSQKKLADIYLNDNDSEVCQAALNKLYDQNLLSDIALNSDDHGKAWIVVWKITKQKLLFDIAKNAKCFTAREAAIERLDIGEMHNVTINDSLRISYKLKTDSIQTLLFDIIKNDSIPNVRYKAKDKLKSLFENLDDQQRLSDVALNCEYLDVRKSAMKNLTDQNTLAHIAKNNLDLDIRKTAIRKLTDKEALNYIAKNDLDLDIKKMAIRKLTDKETLKYIAKKDNDKTIRRYAKKRLKELK